MNLNCFLLWGMVARKGFGVILVIVELVSCLSLFPCCMHFWKLDEKNSDFEDMPVLGLHGEGKRLSFS